MAKKPFYYGYVVLVAATTMLMVSYGAYYSYSVLFTSLESEFNLTKGSTSLIFSIAMLISGSLSVAAGKVYDRIGPRMVCLVAGGAMGTGFILMSLTHASWQVFAVYGLLGAIGAGGLYPAAIPTVARWFTSTRGIMTGIVTSGVGAGPAVFPLLMSRLVVAYGWRRTCLIIGIMVLVVIAATAPFLKREPARAEASYLQPPKKASLTAGTDFTYRQALQTREFWMIALTYICIGFCQTSMMVHIVPFATGMGISAIAAAAGLSVMSTASIIGRLVAGALGDRVHAKLLIIGLTSVLFLSLIGIEFAHSLWLLFLVCAPFGMAYGSSSTVQALATAELFGLGSIGVLLGTMLFSVCLGAAIGPFVTGILADVSSYQTAIIVLIGVALIGVTLALWLPSPAKRGRLTAAPR